MGREASPAVRHAVWILTLSALAGGAGAWLGWRSFGAIGGVVGFLALLITTKLALLVVFVDRFLNRVLGSSIRLRPAHDEASHTTGGHVDHLRALGFVAGETLVMVDDDDGVLGGPYAMLSHSSAPMAAWVGPVGITIGSEIPAGQLLLTTNQPHVPSDHLIAQVFSGEPADALLRHHEEALSRLAPPGIDINARRTDPQHMLVADEECERAYFGGLSRLERLRALLRLTCQSEPSDAGG